MINIQALFGLVSRGVDLIQFVPVERRPDPTAAAIVAVLAGLVLAAWGARLLRLGFVLAFLAAGASLGLRVAQRIPVDALFGLVIGGGLAACLGYFFYRWWVGLTTGVLAVLAVLAIGWPRLADEFQALRGEQLGVGTGEYRLAPPVAAGSDTESGRSGLPQVRTQFWNNVARPFWYQRQTFVVRALVVGSLAWLLGMGLGLMLPRLTTIVGTSFVGVLAVAMGVGVLLRLHRPALWAAVAANGQWYLAAAGLCLIGSLLVQLRQVPGRPVVPVPPLEPAK